jgi:hypothetical protein
MSYRLLGPITAKKGLRAISFHAGVAVGLLAIGAYLGAVNHRWLATAVLILAAMAVATIPLRLPPVR